VISAIYAGTVVHVRTRPKRHKLRYRVAQTLLDLDELPLLDRTLRSFGYNRAGLFSFHDRDHGDGSGDLRGWVENKLTQAGCRFRPGAVRVLCMPRVLGHVFNPLSVYFCHDGEGRLAAVLYEVANTFGERHSYVLPVEGSTQPVRQHCDKAFYVSPFMPMGLRYDFALALPEDSVGVHVATSDEHGLLLDAWFSGERRTLRDTELLGVLAAYPVVTLKVVVAIHWEALKLWLSGVPFIPKARPEQAELPG
jgi:hypothetical protein